MNFNPSTKRKVCIKHLFYLRLIWVLMLSGLSYQLIAQQVSPCLIANGIATGNCPVQGNAYIESPCIAGIQKQIARSVSAENLVEWNTPTYCYGWIPVNGSPYNGSALPDSNLSVNCQKPYDRCMSYYCPEKYCAIIKSIVDLKASIILRTVNVWGRQYDLRPGTDLYKSMGQMVIDINAAYDCAGLTRPVIQGTILENIEPSIGLVPIPADIINALRNTTGFENAYYLDANGNPKTNLKFQQSRMVFPEKKEPNIRLIETRLWFFYLAKMYIDMGYKSIHMGQLEVWGKTDKRFNYYYTLLILDKIRQYAASQNTFVLLTEENNRALKAPNTDNFMFDYDSRALRPREISNPQVCGDGGCNNTPVNYLQTSPCASELFPAIIDECVIGLHGNTGGYSPVSGCYLPFQPYNTYFDFSNGYIVDSQGNVDTAVATEGCGSNVVYGTWGWDDSKWFADKISMNCRSFWMQDAIWRIRQPWLGFGSMVAPTLLHVKKPEIANNYLSGINPTADGRYLMTDESIVQNVVANAWIPKNTIDVTALKTCVVAGGYCPGITFPREIRRKNVYSFTINNPDNTTVYTWHVQRPDGTWMPFTYRSLIIDGPPVSGYYNIYVRQDNLGEFDNNNSVKTKAYRMYLYADCCSGNLAAERGEQPPYPQEKEGAIPFEEYFEFSAYEQYIADNAANYAPDVAAKSNHNNLTIYPNPVNNFLQVQTSAATPEPYNFKIVDITGKTIIKKQQIFISNQPYSIDVASLVPALYFIQLTDKTGITSSFKFIKE